MSAKETRGKLTPLQAGIAGEYFVAAELTRRGYVASLTLRNTRGIDILVSNRDATKAVGIQVKTSRGSTPKWMLNKKAETDLAENLFYVFVCLPPESTPMYYVVPRKVVGEFVQKTHQDWLAKPGRTGQAHRDSDLRSFRDPEGRYRDRWESLGLE